MIWCVEYDTLISGPFNEKRRKPLSLHSLKQVKEPARLPYCYYHNNTRFFSRGDELDPGIRKSSNQKTLLEHIVAEVIPLYKRLWEGGHNKQLYLSQGKLIHQNGYKYNHNMNECHALTHRPKGG